MIDFISDIFWVITQFVNLLFRLPLVTGVTLGGFLLFAAVINIVAAALWR